MLKNKVMIAVVVAGSFAAFPLASFAKDIYISVDPPSRRVEHMEAREGYVIVPGAWHYVHGKHQWVAGHYVAERRGYNWQGDRWVQHDNRKWTMQRGGWSRDSDGDGTPDRLDSQPNNPRRQ